MDAQRTSETELALARAGVPPRIVAHVLKEPPRHWLGYLVSVSLYLSWLLAGFAFGGFYLWPALKDVTRYTARADAEAAGALLYSYNFGVSLIIALFGWGLIAATISGLITALSKRLTTAVFVVAALNATSGLNAWIFRHGLKRVHAESDPSRYLRKAVQTPNYVTGVGVALAVISAIAVQRDVQTHSIFTATAYVRSPFLPWGSTEPRMWSSAVSVETGCNHIENKGKVEDDLIYEIRFADGASVRIGEATPLHGSWLEAAEVIDRELKSANAVFKRWSWLGRDPEHPLCLAAMESRYSGQEYERVRRLIGLSE
jgi:hypothetical protein